MTNNIIATIFDMIFPVALIGLALCGIARLFLQSYIDKKYRQYMDSRKGH